MRSRTILGLATISFILMGCQSNTFKITGHVEGLTEGDTLLITNADSMYTMRHGDSPNPGEKIAVHEDGSFEYHGYADTVERCILYNPKSEYNFYEFFREPGTKLQMKLYTGPASTGFNYVNGSKLNDDLTSITNTIEKCQNEITRIEINAKAKNVPEERYQTKIQILQQQIRTIIIHGINDNINNELGYYLLTSYSNGWGIDDNVLLSLIHELPQKAKKSENILKLTAALRAKNNIAIGTRIIGFQMPSPDNKDVVLYNEIRRNKITIIDFWASWCGPCRESIPNLNSLYMNFHHRGLGIVGISLDSDLNEWSQAIKELHIKWTQMSDLKGWNNLAAESLGITSIPFNIIVDDSGIILAKNLKADEISTFVKNKLK